MSTSGIEAGAEKPAAQSTPSPQEQLKAIVSGAARTEAAKAEPHASEPEAAKSQPVVEPVAPGRKAASAAVRARPTFRLDGRVAGVACAALAVGTLVGAGASTLSAPRIDRAAGALTEVQSGLEASRVEAARLNTEIERIGRTLAALKDANEVSRGDAKTRASGVTERLTKMEQTVSARLTALGERIEQSDREHATRMAALATSIEKRPVAASVVAPAPAPAASAKAEPAQTGAIPEKPKPAVIEGWAVRDVYDGAAMLEDKKRRLVEVAPGDTVPGIGRVEAVERRGRDWVVVTRQGLITPQSW
ncbi:hypothetical protein [Methylobacterium durans]|uniref:Uncharacterized protein n=1 Tax=Methylobacterium durans TaxID=2202825 RepID=A0A2U8W041_9HYPH|nr:hypothetical protein [Methylobacterium durans]AWN39417.1 hypothetical protein DK389_01205 [Methylobacterium durans]